MSKQSEEPNEKTNLVLRVGNRVPFSGLICALLAGVAFVGSKILIKKVDTIHPTVNVTIRGLFIMLIYGSISLIKGLRMTGENRKEFLGLCGRGFFGFLVSVTSYTALWRIPLGDSVTLLLTATVFTPIIARIFIREKFDLINIFCLVTTMLGVVLIAKPPVLIKLLDLMHVINVPEETVYDIDKLIGIGLTLFAAVSFAFAYVILRALKGVEVDLIVTYFGIFNFFGTFMILPFIKPFIDRPETVRLPSTLHEWYFTLGITLCGFVGEFFLTSAFQLEKAGYIAILRSFDTVIAFVAESIFFDSDWHEVNCITLIGAGFILFSVVLTTGYKMMTEKKLNEQDELNLKEEKNSQTSNLQKC